LLCAEHSVETATRYNSELSDLLGVYAVAERDEIAKVHATTCDAMGGSAWQEQPCFSGRLHGVLFRREAQRFEYPCVYRMRREVYIDRRYLFPVYRSLLNATLAQGATLPRCSSPYYFGHAVITLSRITMWNSFSLHKPSISSTVIIRGHRHCVPSAYPNRCYARAACQDTP
jgi:hypothetical protein